MSHHFSLNALYYKTLSHFLLIPITPLTLTQISCSVKEKKIKNVTKDELGATLGRVHMERQDMAGLQLKKTPALKEELRERKRSLKLGEGEDEERRGGEGPVGEGRPSKKIKA